MTILLSDLMFVHSGGAANYAPSADLGGAISTAGQKRIKSQTASVLTNITGVTVTDAFGNAEGVGLLTYVNSTKMLGWKPFGSSTFNGQVCSINGVYLLGTSLGYLLVTVVAASYPSSDQMDTVSITAILENLFNAVTPAQALAGKVSYRCYYLLNSSATQTAINVTLWVKQNTPGEDTMHIGLGTSAIDIAEQTIGNELTAPVGINWVAPTTKATGLVIGNLAPGSYKSIWQRRTVPAETRGTVITNSAIIAVSADV